MDFVGSTLNKRYRLDRKIGEGGFASVFLATDLLLRRSVAVKLLGQNWARDKDLLTRFQNEAQVIAALNHPNIMQIFDYGVSKGAPYLVMPYLSGGTLAERMKRERLTLDEIGVYLQQVGSALDYAHQHNVIHRDIKPANLLIRDDGQLVLMDFGLAKLLDNVFLEASTLVLGTVAYMAPEQCMGMVSAASDFYMLGIILYQMLTGKLPFEGNTTQVMVGHVHASLTPLTGQPSMEKVPSAVLAALDQVLIKVLAKAPAERYQTGQALTSAYYNALKADPRRAGRYNNRDNQVDAGDVIKTIVDKKQNILSNPQPERGKEAEVSPASLASPLKPTDTAHPAYPELSPVNREDAIHQAPYPGDRYPTPAEQHPLLPGKPTDPALQTVHQATPGKGLSLPQPSLIPSNKAAIDVEDTIVAPPSVNRRQKKLLKPPRLFVTTEPDKGIKVVFDLTGDTIKLGRAIDNNLLLPLGIVSRYHAEIRRITSGSRELAYKIVQLQPRNPLCFHGKEVTEKVLEDGDTFEIGQRGFAEYIVKLTYRAAEYESI